MVRGKTGKIELGDLTNLLLMQAEADRAFEDEQI
jgi:hypothetical protein